MHTNHASTIRIMSIIGVVFSSLTILGCLLGFLVVGIGGYAANEFGPDAITYSHNVHDNSIAGHMDELRLSEDDVMGLLNLVVMLGGVSVGYVLVTALVTLIAGIIGIRGADAREKLGSVFGWSIAGGVAALLSGRLITAALFVVTAAFAHGDKNAPVEAVPVQQTHYSPAGYNTAAPNAAQDIAQNSYAQTYPPAGYVTPMAPGTPAPENTTGSEADPRA